MTITLTFQAEDQTKIVEERLVLITNSRVGLWLFLAYIQCISYTFIELYVCQKLLALTDDDIHDVINELPPPRFPSMSQAASHTTSPQRQPGELVKHLEILRQKKSILHLDGHTLWIQLRWSNAAILKLSLWNLWCIFLECFSNEKSISHERCGDLIDLY